MKYHFQKSEDKGFTLIELVVAVGIFALVATLSVSSLLVLTATETRVFAVQTAQDNLRYALETMAREIRTGTCYRGGDTDPASVCFGIESPLQPLTKNCTNTHCLQFRNAAGKEVKYDRGTGEGICRAASGSEFAGGCLIKSSADTSADISTADAYPLTSPEVKIEDLEFYVSGENDGDAEQPRVTIILKASTKDKKGATVRLDVQTTVSQLEQDS